MKSLISSLVGLLLLALAGQSAADESKPRVLMQTNMGDIVIELVQEKAPKTVANFLQYVDDGFYDGTIFHRVISNFMLQGGGFSPDMEKKETREPITNEADIMLRNTIGTIAMARTGNPHSATAQFFINVKNNSALDHREKVSSASWGYAVFGRVIKGMDVVKAIKGVATKTVGPYGDVPQKAIIILKASRQNSTAEQPSGAKP